jgi:hypothetical protein
MQTTCVTPLIIAATGIIQKIPEQHTWKVRHQVTTKKSILGTTNILRKVLRKGTKVYHGK